MVRYLTILLILAPGFAIAQDTDHGRQLAERWCSNCHIVAKDVTTGRADGLPTFPALADNRDTTPISLHHAMTAEHSRMPDFSLSIGQQDDLIAYIFSLRKR